MSIWLASGSFCVFRGGSWSIIPQLARVANRSFDDPAIRGNYLGFRLMRRCT